MESPNNEADRASAEYLLSPNKVSSSGDGTLNRAVGQRGMKEASNNLDCCQGDKFLSTNNKALLLKTIPTEHIEHTQ